VFRAWLGGNNWYVPLMPMSSTAFIVFTLYMIPDPATTPLVRWRQIVFGLSVAILYGLLQIMHVVFGLFIALVVICAIRGISIAIYTAFLQRPAEPSSEAARVSAPQLVAAT
jgi:hypothetical protein